MARGLEGVGVITRFVMTKSATPTTLLTRVIFRVTTDTWSTTGTATTLLTVVVVTLVALSGGRRGGGDFDPGGDHRLHDGSRRWPVDYAGAGALPPEHAPMRYRDSWGQSPPIFCCDDTDLQLGQPSLRVAFALAMGAATGAFGLHPTLAFDIMLSCPRRAAELLWQHYCVLTLAPGAPRIWHQGCLLVDPFPSASASAGSLQWEARVAACSAALVGGQALAVPNSVGPAALAKHAGVAEVLSPGVVQTPVEPGGDGSSPVSVSDSHGPSVRAVSRPDVNGAPSGGSLANVRAVIRRDLVPGASGSGKRVAPGPFTRLGGMLLRADVTLIDDSDRKRLAASMTDNVWLCATILTAEQILVGISPGGPSLIHHLGRILALPEGTWEGADLVWAKELYRIQQTILPVEYVATTQAEPAAPPDYLATTPRCSRCDVPARHG